MLIIEGRGNNIIAVSGDMQEEFSYKNPQTGDLIAFSDGSMIRVTFDRHGHWHITPVNVTPALHIEQTSGKGGTDRATLHGPIQWVVQVGDHLISPFTPELPLAWSDLLAGLLLLAGRQNNPIWPLQCSNDTLTVNADPGKFTADELARLAKLGFDANHPDVPDAPVFTSNRFGSS